MPKTLDQWEAEIERYLEQRVDSGEVYVKSRHIANELDVSAKKVGLAITRLADSSTALAIDTWGGTSDGTTWVVRPNQTQNANLTE